MKILLIEDDLSTASFIENGLKNQGYTVLHLDHGEDGLYAFLNEPFDLAIIDVMLPGVSGLEIIQEIKSKKIDTPIIILSAKAALSDKLSGFSQDIDDYITKPFSLMELIARVKSVLKRTTKKVDQSVLKFENLSLNTITGEAICNGVVLDLKAKEFHLLRYFLLNKKQVVTKVMLLEAVWGFHSFPETNVVEVCICRLRNKLVKQSNINYIHTLRGIGYILK